MSAKTLSMISSILTALFIFLFGFVLFFGLVVLFNGLSGREATPALMVSLICQGIGLILSAVLAGRLTRTLVEKFNWNRIVVVAASVLAGTALGGVLAVAAVFISVFVAEGLR
jgi:hypothetical protein